MSCTPPMVEVRGITPIGRVRTLFCRNRQTGQTLNFNMQPGLDRLITTRTVPEAAPRVTAPLQFSGPPPPITIAAPKITTTPQALNQSAATLRDPTMASTGQTLAANRIIAVGGNRSNLSFGGIVRGIGQIGRGIITGVTGIPLGSQPTAAGPGTNPTGGGPCPQGTIRVGTTCIDPLAFLPGGNPLTFPVTPGMPTGPTGRTRPMPSAQGGGFPPTMVASTRSDCGPKFVLGDDGLCYRAKGFPNSQRMWPKGRAPLLTGGERNAITRANRAAKKIERTTKQLQRMGMIKKPSPRRLPAPRARHQHEIGPGATRIINVGD